MTDEREPLTQDGIDCWRVNYALHKSPHELHDFWRDGAPPGAALALKAAVAEIDRLREENARLLADADRRQALDSHGQYWVENRGKIIDAVTAAGFRLMANAEGFWLQPLSARVVPPVIIAANLDSNLFLFRWRWR